MKRTLSSLTLALVLIFSLFTVCYAGSEPNYKAVYDRAGVFTEAEIKEIEAAVQKYYADSYARAYVVTDGSTDPRNYTGDDFLREYGISGDVIVLIITDNAKKNYNIYPYGKCYSKISDAEYDGILDDSGVYNNIKSGRYALGAIRCIELCETACRPNIRAYVIGAAITVTLITGIFVVCVVYSYKRKLRSEKYPLDRFARLDLNVRRDELVNRFVTVTVIRSESSGGNRGGNRGGGGGGRRGGR